MGYIGRAKYDITRFSVNRFITNSKAGTAFLNCKDFVVRMDVKGWPDADFIRNVPDQGYVRTQISALK